MRLPDFPGFTYGCRVTNPGESFCLAYPDDIMCLSGQLNTHQLRSPKQVTLSGKNVEQRWYPYYAGYTEGFVDDVLSALSLEAGSVVLDPWNGSGTTTVRAAHAGYRALGLDANPVLVVVARGRLLPADVLASGPLLIQEIVESATGRSRELDEEPLRAWFRPETAAYVRSLEASIQHLLVDHDAYAPLSTRGIVDISTLASLFYVALFASVRYLLRPFRGSNPTWIRRPSNENDRIPASRAHINELFSVQAARLLDHLHLSAISSEAGDLATVDIADSTSVELNGLRPDAVIGSPPYCTRIDYVVATTPELAVLGYSANDMRTLRERMIGTPTVASEPLPASRLGPKTLTLLERIRDHESKASATYYHKYYEQYFRGMALSLDSLAEVVAPDSQMVLVVQDSYYKDIHVDLAALLSQMAAERGWRVVGAQYFDVPRSKAAMNPGARKYRSSFKVRESAVFLRRSGS